MSKREKMELSGGMGGSAITVKVIPRSSKRQVAEILDDGTVKIRLTMHTEDEINIELIQYLAEICQITPDQIEIVAGSKGRDKLVAIFFLDSKEVQSRLLKNLA